MATKMINLKINNIPVKAPEGSTILEAAKLAGIKIPTLCWLKETNEIGACRMCLVEVKNARGLCAACVYPISEGMEVQTNTPRLRKTRKTNLELILSTHNKDCLACAKSMHCELQKLSYEYDCDTKAFAGAMPTVRKDGSSPSIFRDTSKCILCKRCSAVCAKVQNVKAIDPMLRGFETYIGCAFGADIAETACVGCGQCTLVCPTGALVVKDDAQLLKDAIANPNLVTVVAIAPSVRVALGEEFGMPIGTNVEGKTFTALRRLGFDYVHDVDFGADLTIMEEGTEFLHRVKNKGVLPLITSCSPGWINFVTAYYPEFIPNLSTAKSPQNMQGACTKTYWAQKMKIDPKKIFFCSIMPCTAKKYEIKQRDNAVEGCYDVDASISVRELGRWLKEAAIDFVNLPDSKPDDPLGQSTGAGTIFGVTGGVMEAGLRTVADILTGKDLEGKAIEYNMIRGLEGIREAKVEIAGKVFSLCSVSGLNNCSIVLENIKSGKKKYDWIEVMACPGGCVNGGGMPLHDPTEVPFMLRAKLRGQALYKDDERDVLRKSHKNPSIIKIYKEFFGQPGSKKAHHILHTSYKVRKYI